MLYRGPCKYIEKIVNLYEKLHSHKPKEFTSLLEKGEHQEVNDSLELNEDGAKCYQSMIVAFQGHSRPFGCASRLVQFVFAREAELHGPRRNNAA
jgi:hypothetical protein